MPYVGGSSYSHLKNELSSCCLVSGSSQLQESLKKLLNIHHRMVPVRQICNCNSIMDAFELLEKWGIVSEERCGAIMDLCHLLGLPPTERISFNYNDYSLCSCGFAQRTKSDRQISTISSKYEDIYEYLSEHLGERWVDMAKKLQGMTLRVEELRVNLGMRQKDKIYTVLEEFEAKSPTGTLECILNALKKSELNKHHDYILKHYSHHL